MRDVTTILVAWAVSTVALFALLDWDESRLSRDALADAWPPATRTLAAAYLGILVMPIHIYRTRARRFVEPAILRWTRRLVGDGVATLLGRLPSLLFEILLWLFLTGPLAVGVSLLVDGVIEEAIDLLPESALGWVLGAALSGFAAAMITRHRRRSAPASSLPARS
jgi:hypothetical protein